jgi:hypothetical protein
LGHALVGFPPRRVGTCLLDHGEVSAELVATTSPPRSILGIFLVIAFGIFQVSAFEETPLV